MCVVSALPGSRLETWYRIIELPNIPGGGRPHPAQEKAKDGKVNSLTCCPAEQNKNRGCQTCTITSACLLCPQSGRENGNWGLGSAAAPRQGSRRNRAGRRAPLVTCIGGQI